MYCYSALHFSIVIKHSLSLQINLVELVFPRDTYSKEEESVLYFCD